MQLCTLSPLSTFIKCDQDTTINLNYLTLQTGFEFIVGDDLGLASPARPITIVASLAPGVSVPLQITNPGGLIRLTWMGAFYGLG